MPDWQLVYAQLRASKVLDRKAGVAAVRHAFRPDHPVRFDGGRDDENWVALFKALFRTIEVERKAFIVRSSNAAKDRLESGISTVRWVIERSYHLFQKPALITLIISLRDMSIYRSQLFLPASRDCIGTLRTIVSYPPHVRNLELDQWTSLLSLAFAVLLDKPLDFDLAANDLLSGMGEGGENDPTGSLPSLISRKRRAVDAHTPEKRQKRTQKQLSHEQIHCAGIVLDLIASRQLQEDLVIRVLDLLRAFLSEYPTETSAHRSILPALNVILAHVTLNARAATVSFARTMWMQVLSLWNTKDSMLKEALIIGLMHLLPFYSVDVVEEVDRLSVADGLSKLIELGELEPDSTHGVSTLPADALRFAFRVSDSEGPSVFESASFLSGPTFSPANALSWAALELSADAVHLLKQLSDNLTQSSTGAPRPISGMLASLRTFRSTQSRIWIIQRILFLVERHWSTLSVGVQKDIVSALTALLAHDDAETQSWVFICISSIAHASGSREGLANWDLVWNFAIARVRVATTSLSPERAIGDIEILARELTIQGPALLTDSVCSFLSRCVRFAGNNARLSKAQLPDKILDWMGRAWDFSRPLWTVRDVFLLLELVCGLRGGRADGLCRDREIPDCAIADACFDTYRTFRVRDFVLYARLGHGSASMTAKPKVQRTARRGTTSLRPCEKKASALLLKALTAVRSLSMQIPGHARVALDVAVLALVFESALELNGADPSRDVVGAACRVFAAVGSQTVNWWSWTPHERAYVIRAIDPLLPLSALSTGDDSARDILARPGDQSGIEAHKLANLRFVWSF
ncbi:hypothetical protein AURDEDRAFT_171964 [Auricularia subglabra TFB-10046 SS5]|nr:hypothetical protein AURDEDRAFT_171964 [Auricularia subglabra TFB-10046 SS5]